MGSKQTTNTSSTQNQQSFIDPAIEGLQVGNYNNVQNLINKGPSTYSGPLVGNFDNTTLPGAISTASGLSNYKPIMVDPALMGGVPHVTGQDYSASTYDPAQLASTDLSPYLNPYTSDVINTSMNDLARQTAQQISAGQGQATAAGAFGGSREGVADALTNEAAQRTGASLFANLNQSNFAQAQAAALQDILAKNTAGQFNANALNTAGEFNAGQNQQALLANQNVDLNTAAANQAAENAARLANQSADLSGAGVRGNAASLLTGIAGAQQAQQTQADQAAYDEWLRQQNWALGAQPILNQSLGMIQAPQYVDAQGHSTSTTTQNPGFMGILGGLGGLAMGLGTMGMGAPGMAGMCGTGGIRSLFGGGDPWAAGPPATIGRM